jgi:hypothetical protein
LSGITNTLPHQSAIQSAGYETKQVNSNAVTFYYIKKLFEAILMIFWTIDLALTLLAKFEGGCSKTELHVSVSDDKGLYSEHIRFNLTILKFLT